jgi:hypothetical protein
MALTSGTHLGAGGLGGSGRQRLSRRWHSLAGALFHKSFDETSRA